MLRWRAVSSALVVVVTFLVLTGCGDNRPFPVGEQVVVRLEAAAPAQIGYVKGQISGYADDSARIRLTTIELPEHNDSDYAELVRSAAVGDEILLPVDALMKASEDKVSEIKSDRAIYTRLREAQLAAEEAIYLGESDEQAETAFKRLEQRIEATEHPVADVFTFYYTTTAIRAVYGSGKAYADAGDEGWIKVYEANGFNQKRLLEAGADVAGAEQVRDFYHKHFPPAGIGFADQPLEDGALQCGGNQWQCFQPKIGLHEDGTNQGLYETDMAGVDSPVMLAPHVFELNRIVSGVISSLITYQRKADAPDPDVVRERARGVVTFLTDNGQRVPDGHSVDGLVEALIEKTRAKAQADD